MAEQTRLAKLPGYDTAPDVYETPETAVETPATSVSVEETTSDSADSETGEATNSDEEEDGPFGGISHRKLLPERARSRFQAVGSRVETRGLDLSDRVDGRRRGLQMRHTRPGVRDNGDETLEARIARLRREVEECRMMVQESPKTDESGSVDALVKALTDLETGSQSTRRTATSKNHDGTKIAIPTDAIDDTAADSQTLGRITAFDTRLSTLEKALGLATMDMNADGSFTAPILPSLNLLDQQISALMASTSVTQLDAASSRIRGLIQEAEKLSRIQHMPAAESNGDNSGESKDSITTFSADDLAKLDSLYALLPTMQGLTPTIPALTERLRSLVVLHTDAANAAGELDTVVKKQADMQAELQTWQAALERLESVVKNALEANGRNGKFVEGWVQDLQKRMEALR